MKTQSFSKRVSLYFMTATAVLIIVVFTTIYLVVFKTVFTHLDKDLNAEYQEVSNSIIAFDDDIIFANKGEWTEPEHGQIEVNPTFLQVTDTLGNILRKSSNLEEASLVVYKNKGKKIYINTSLANKKIRQLQVLLKDEHLKKIGYISIAVSLEDAQMVLLNLRIVLFILFPLVLVVLYFSTKFIAQKSIEPIILLSENADKITRESLDKRIPFPPIKDELYKLTENINSLLNRIEEAIKREKQFSSDASHELRTPLAVLKGTLEVMIRKPRDTEYYNQKALACLDEINRMTVLVEQLLLLARYENTIEVINITEVYPGKVIHQIIARHADMVSQKEIIFDLDLAEYTTIRTDAFMFEQIVENIITNALKYSRRESNIGISLAEKDQKISLIVKDEGEGINIDEISHIFDRFYRSDISRNSQIKGYGLGLAIVKRFTDLLHIDIQVSSRPQQGTEFTLTFPGQGN
jgi:signal transduction histidine kinase